LACAGARRSFSFTVEAGHGALQDYLLPKYAEISVAMALLRFIRSFV